MTAGGAARGWPRARVLQRPREERRQRPRELGGKIGEERGAAGPRHLRRKGELPAARRVRSGGRVRMRSGAGWRTRAGVGGAGPCRQAAARGARGAHKGSDGGRWMQRVSAGPAARGGKEPPGPAGAAYGGCEALGGESRHAAHRMAADQATTRRWLTRRVCALSHRRGDPILGEGDLRRRTARGRVRSPAAAPRPGARRQAPREPRPLSCCRTRRLPASFWRRSFARSLCPGRGLATSEVHGADVDGAEPPRLAQGGGVRLRGNLPPAEGCHKSHFSAAPRASRVCLRTCG